MPGAPSSVLVPSSCSSGNMNVHELKNIEQLAAQLGLQTDGRLPLW